MENALLWRDEVEDELGAGGRVSPERAKLLAEADTRLVAASRSIVKRFPGLFGDFAKHPLRYWWWHLDKGPRVREKAGRAAVRINQVGDAPAYPSCLSLSVPS